jgi:hypothetical protein
MRGYLFVRLLLVGSLFATAACANSGQVDPRSNPTHNVQQRPIDGGTGSGGGGGGGY